MTHLVDTAVEQYRAALELDPAYADILFGLPRSPEWPAARAAHLAVHPTCAACGRADHLQVHHVEPFHSRPELELVEANLVTLCEYPTAPCHWLFGHCGVSWRAWNPLAREHAAAHLDAVLAARRQLA
jgi:5-methylcytosine-specific restriction protein A